MAHSKRNTSLAFFTSHERAQLKSTWGSQRTHLSRDSFLPFSSCQLCLLPSRDPIACAHGDVFCRECAVSNLLAQRQEIKRLEKEEEKRRKEEGEQSRREEDEAAERAVREFEMVQMGLEKAAGGARVVGREGGKIVVEKEEVEGAQKRTKRKFELDEDELVRVAQEERTRMKRKVHEEKRANARSNLPSFWVPSQTPGVGVEAPTKKKKLDPVCPASSEESPHPISLKSLTNLKFTEETSAETGKVLRSCPACRKALSNSTKAFFTIPCGHVLCKPCVEKFMKVPTGETNPHVEHKDDSLRCYVCDTYLSGNPAKEGKEKKSKKDKEKDKEKLKPSLIEIRSEGTGFAGGGKNVVERKGIAFQC
ncbi:hypothetical protein M501DRAFT_595982 [Patellaria atrata CBS 101060]|uniref:RING-type domain-containing protein n=1 Tax=Patellaria atrata CBS 101060 TaxID=1346257 RepID=A0A9P4VNE1_9PEZI|nr:hypothetical protein M501DRAFT_595982 [Patellaria atrata CBS 101060]